jgi:hypothetical protein
VVVRASEEEAAEHARVLESIAKDSKGRLVWQVEPATA